MNLPSPSRATPSLRRRTALGAAALVLSIASTASHASIESAPVSIVDHGSFITDVANGRDWYKFSNADSTLGLSFEAALAHFAAAGWSSANVAQVQALQGQFGWTHDTPGALSNANYGLTDAMASYLGYTATLYFGSGPSVEGRQLVDAITSDLIYIGDVGFHAVSQSETYELDDARGTFYYGDAVEGIHDALAFGTSDETYGVWLTRASIAVPGAAGPGTSELPEPGTWLLIAAGVVAGLAERRRAMRRGTCEG